MLLEDVPGTAKTVLARAIAQSIEGAQASRIQCTPDLQPTDVTGLSIFNQRERDFEFRPGTGVRQRRPRRRDQPRDAEDAVRAARGDGRAAGDRRRSHAPARRRRSSSWRPRTRSSTRARSRCRRRSSTASSLRTTLGYPDAEDENRIVEEQLGGHPLTRLEASVDVGGHRGDERRGAARSSCTRRSRAGSSTSCAATRELDVVAIGSSVRGSLALNRAARAWAMLNGRRYVTPEDVERLIEPVLMHRLLFRPELPRGDPRPRLEGSRAPTSRPAASRSRRSRASTSTSTSPQRRRSGDGGNLPAHPAPARGRPRVRRRAQRPPRPGSDIAGSREYRTGDDVAWIDWPSSARLSAARDNDEFIVHELFADESPRVVVLADRRALDGDPALAAAPSRQAAGAARRPST